VNLLVLNAGSSSLKVSLLDPADRLLLERNQPVQDGDVPAALEAVLGDLPDGGRDRVGAVGHRVVHGGDAHVAPARVDDDLRRSLEQLVDLAPLHQPAALAGLDAAAKLLPGVPAVACFDTAFHATLPAAASTYPLPARWRELGVRRYGFHGLSHAYASRRAAELVGADDPEAAAGLRVVSCHLGAGASLAAVRGGRSVDTTMGFTPLEGLMMARRSGSVDPGALLWLQQRHGLSAEELNDGLEHGSGFAGLAGTTDQAEAIRRAGAGDAEARLALEVYLHRLRAAVAAMAAALGGLDALVFTGGVGEASAPVRAGCAGGLGFLGVTLDAAANSRAGQHDGPDHEPDHEISGPAARVRSFVIRAREDLQIAREVRALLA
jgi:acetate kinase